jgi:hypothetical protein
VLEIAKTHNLLAHAEIQCALRKETTLKIYKEMASSNSMFINMIKLVKEAGE